MRTIELTKRNGHKVSMSLESVNAWLQKNCLFGIVTCTYGDMTDMCDYDKSEVIGLTSPIKETDTFGLRLKAVKVWKRL